MKIDKLKTLIIGLGQIGYSNAEYMTSRELRVDGFDLNKNATANALDHGVIRREAASFEGYDFYVICVSTHDPQNMLQPSFSGLFQTAHRLSYEGKKDALVLIESTVTKGTSRRVIGILEHRLHVAHAPHRFYAQEKEEHGVRQVRVLGGCDDCCTRRALHFYKRVLDIPVYVVHSIELAEMSKVIENSYRFVEIAFAEELKMFCDVNSLDFDELRGAINSKWNVKILEARQGIGGQCLPKDSQMYLDLSKRASKISLVDSAKIIDAQYRLIASQDLGVRLIVPAELVKMNLT